MGASHGQSLLEHQRPTPVAASLDHLNQQHDTFQGPAPAQVGSAVLFFHAPHAMNPEGSLYWLRLVIHPVQSAAFFSILVLAGRTHTQTARVSLEGLNIKGWSVEEYVRETLGEDTCDARRCGEMQPLVRDLCVDRGW